MRITNALAATALCTAIAGATSVVIVGASPASAPWRPSADAVAVAIPADDPVLHIGHIAVRPPHDDPPVVYLAGAGEWHSLAVIAKPCLNVRRSPGLAARVIVCAARDYDVMTDGRRATANGLQWQHVEVAGALRDPKDPASWHAFAKPVWGWAVARYLVEDGDCGPGH